jgi:hypothetical protein
MIFLRADKSSPGACAVVVSLAYVLANNAGVMADDGIGGPGPDDCIPGWDW